MSIKQQLLKDKHGTPDEFEDAVWRAYNDLVITHQEAEAAIRKYRREWEEAADPQGK